MDIFRLTPAADGNVAWPTLSTSKKSVVTVGAFDGLHVGHHAVIEETVRQARKLDAYSVVIMFDPRPAFVHAYAKAHAGKDVPAGVHDPEAITGVDARLRMLSRMHVDYVLIVRYTIAFSEKSFRFFLGQLVGKLGMRMLVLGEDARMGANLEGDIKKIRTLAEATGVFELEVVTNQGGTVRVPERFTPTAPNEPGDPGGPLEGLGKGTPSLVISLCRYLVIIVPLAFLLSRVLGAAGVWHAFWITELFPAGIALAVYRKAVQIKV